MSYTITIKTNQLGVLAEVIGKGLPYSEKNGGEWYKEYQKGTINLG